ncbi:LPS-assembly protein LptD [Sedimentimonas flavescens]|uniref:LPS-assembly protein LptD n=1 Tax=Sedimentimonas flavescens TaxID=2851012 RepID=UPI001C4A50DF|nr:LPS assembly protein LptD [Sedimentimonas flavescens]MBW0157870.1 LPS assembly protein LptD [Sedimentimonas flavescens]
MGFFRSAPVTLLAVLALGTALGGVYVPRAFAQSATAATAVDEAATLLADRILLTASDQLIAEGAVEIYYRSNRLSASRLIYDKKADRLTVEGPIRLIEPGEAGNVLLADQAELSRDLQNGIMVGARMVMARELQLAAARIERKDGRITTFSQVVASSCEICVTDPTPLWEIRARQITHDAEARQLVFDGAQFRVMGAPVFYFPHMRMPDPTVERMSGFLMPSVRTTSNLGTGIKVPYFFTLGDSADLTVEPYLSTSETVTLGMRYRRAFDNGTLEVNGAFSRDDILKDEDRGYLFIDSRFALPDDFNLGLQLRLTSDDAYLVDYDITDDDRLWSGVTLDRVRRDELIWARIGNTHSLREGESNSTEPMLAGDAQWIQVFRPGLIGGEATLEWQLGALRRAADSELDGGDLDLIPDGRDRVRASLVADWRRNWLLSGGILASTEAELALDAAVVNQDPNYETTNLRALPSLGLELRWPWVKTSGAAAHVIEPVAQLIWSRDSLDELPNEDSWLTEFDEGNLFAFSRFPGGDMRERGLRANLGLSWTRNDAAGWSLGVTAGRVFHAEDLGQFSSGSGLSGTRSDWLVAAHLSGANGLMLSNRALFDDDLNFSRDELRLAYAADRYQIGAGYLWMEENPDEGRDDAISELQLESGWGLGRGWSGKFDARYDFTADRASRASLGLQYATECVTVDLSLSRRFTSSSSVKPETGIGLSVQLAGFGAKAASGAERRVCTR